MASEEPKVELAAPPAPRPKLPKTEAQMEAFARAQSARAANVQARRAAQAEQHELARKIMEEKYGEKVNSVLGPRGRGQPTREEQFLLAEAREALAMVRDQVQQAKVVEVPVMPSAPAVTVKALQAPARSAAAAAAEPAAPAPTPAPAPVPAPAPAPAPAAAAADDDEESVGGEEELDALAELMMERMQRAKVAKSLKKGRRRAAESSSSDSSSEDEERDRRRRGRRRDQPPPPPPQRQPSVAAPVKPKRNIIFLS